jgi:hypothetical protein
VLTIRNQLTPDVRFIWTARRLQFLFISKLASTVATCNASSSIIEVIVCRMRHLTYMDFPSIFNHWNFYSFYNQIECIWHLNGNLFLYDAIQNKLFSEKISIFIRNIPQVYHVRTPNCFREFIISSHPYLHAGMTNGVNPTRLWCRQLLYRNWCKQIHFALTYIIESSACYKLIIAVYSILTVQRMFKMQQQTFSEMRSQSTPFDSMTTWNLYHVSRKVKK